MNEPWPAPEVWPPLLPGTELTVVKQNPEGKETARYPGAVITSPGPPPWLAVRATWARDRLLLDGLAFVPGDTLHEYFSPVDPFNVFAIFAPDGQLRGWYANVTYPSRLHRESRPPLLIWQDLYLDLVALPDGSVHMRDEDELTASGLREREPALHRAILGSRDELLRRWASRVFPFHEARPKYRSGEGIGG